MSNPDVYLQDIRGSDTYDEWQRQLIDCFYEEEEKDELIRSLRAHLDNRYGSLDSDELEALKKEVVSSLVATAAQKAEHPEPDASPAPAHEPDQWSPPSDLEAPSPCWT